MSFNIEVESGKSKRLLIAGKYCDRDIVVTATGGGGTGDGYDEGYEAGQQAEYDRFWDNFQLNGTRINYRYLFSYTGWTDETLNPKYSITCSGSSSNGEYIFYSATKITRIPKDIIINGVSAAHMFNACIELVTIDKLVLNGATSLSGTFTKCSKLVNITIDGSIDVSFNIQASAVLSVASAKSIIMHLTNYVGTDKDLTYTLTLNDAVWAALEADSVSPDGGTWKTYVNNLGWNA